jgi:hypothetical protein
MSRLVKLLIATTQEQQLGNGIAQIDPSKLTFARARWEFKPSEEWELALGRDEIVAVLETREGKQGEAGWWRGRTRDGRIGWFPGNYVSYGMSTMSRCARADGISGRRDSETESARGRCGGASVMMQTRVSSSRLSLTPNLTANLAGL